MGLLLFNYQVLNSCFLDFYSSVIHTKPFHNFKTITRNMPIFVKEERKLKNKSENYHLFFVCVVHGWSYILIKLVNMNVPTSLINIIQLLRQGN